MCEYRFNLFRIRPRSPIFSMRASITPAGIGAVVEVTKQDP